MTGYRHTIEVYDGTKLIFTAKRTQPFDLMLMPPDVRSDLERAYKENFDIACGSMCLAWGPSSCREEQPHVYRYTHADVTLFAMHKIGDSWREDVTTRREVRVDLISDHGQEG